MTEETPQEILQRACDMATEKATTEVNSKDPRTPSADITAWTAFNMHPILFKETMKQLRALKARVAEIESKGVEYRGVYQAA